MEKRAKYAKLHPEMSNLDLTKILSKKYKELPEKKKVGGGGFRCGRVVIFRWEQLVWVGQWVRIGLRETRGPHVRGVDGSTQQCSSFGGHPDICPLLAHTWSDRTHCRGGP